MINNKKLLCSDMCRTEKLFYARGRRNYYILWQYSD